MDVLSSDAKVIYYDQRGCGKSEKADCYTWQMHVQDLKRIVNALAPNKRVILAGSSWGTTLALLYAYTYPEDVNALILSGTYAWPGRGATKRDCSFYRPPNVRDTMYTMSMKYGIRMSIPKEKDKKEQDSLKKELKLFESHPVAQGMTQRSASESPALSELRKIKSRVLIFEGKGICDQKNPTLKNLKDGTGQFKGLLQNLEVYSINACHDPWYSNSADFFSKVKDFIQKPD